jgi:hypothetical protein
MCEGQLHSQLLTFGNPVDGSSATQKVDDVREVWLNQAN